MRIARFIAALCLLSVAGPLAAEESERDPGYESFARAYTAVSAKQYDEAIKNFEAGLRLSPHRADVRKDLAYTYLKTGDTELAREQFGEAMRLNPADTHVALEYAFLCFEARDVAGHGDAITFKATARRIFDRVRREGDEASRATAGGAFQNIDAPLASGIERWKQALSIGPQTFSAHFELAELAEQRDELELAADHYRRAWLILPARTSVLLDLGRVLAGLNRREEGNAAWLAASRGGEPRTAELARALLPAHYPWVNEFRRAIDLDPRNVALHRELAYLLLRMAEQKQAPPVEAENEFRVIVQAFPDDALSLTQLGFLYLSRQETGRAMPLLERVMNGGDQELANRVRVTLRLPAKLAQSGTPEETGADPSAMAEKSLQAGFLKDALKYLRLAHAADPLDFSVMLKLGSVYNMLHDDATAMRWFALARRGTDADVAGQAAEDLHALRPAQERFRTTAWAFPVYSSRWKDLFSYAQVKTEMKLDGTSLVRPYLSVRFVGDTRGTLPGVGVAPQYLSESAIIIGGGVATRNWHGAMAWAEAGSSLGYLDHHIVPDYRGGLSWARAHGPSIFAHERGLFWESNEDAVYVRRFDRDTIGYLQNRIGFTPATPLLQTQFFWNLNATADWKRQYWANFVETGPGVRFHWTGTPNAMTFTVSALRGVYLVNQGNPHRPNFNEVRASVWYALTH